jgi:predicted permease
MVSALSIAVALLLVGYLLRKSGRMPDNAADTLNRFVIDVCVPAAILRLVPTLTFTPSLAVLVIVPWVMAGLAYLTARAASRWFGLDQTTATALFLLTGLSNTSFLGFPLCSALLGERSLPLAAVYDQLGSFLLLGTVAPVALARVTAGERPRASAVARRILSFPPLIALVVALLPLPRPALLEPLLMTASAPLVPVAMVAVGLKLRLTPPRPIGVLVLGLVLKLAAFPAAALLLAHALGAPPLVKQVATLESAMPTMVSAGALMMAYGVAGDLAAAFVGWGLVISLGTVPLWAFLLKPGG